MISTLSRRHRRPPLLNPYVVVADVTINLLLIVVAYFLISSRINEAVYAAEEQRMRAAKRPLTYLNKYCRTMIRNGSTIYFRFPNAVIYNGREARLSRAGRLAVHDLASLLKNPSFSNKIKTVRLTVTYPTEWQFTGASAQADALTAALKGSGVRLSIIPSGRTQRNPEVKNKHRISETDLGVELKEPSNLRGR